LIENYEGAFPAWLAPEQVAIMNITDSQAEYAKSVEEKLNAKGFRVLCDLRNEKIGFKIREHTLQKIPYLLVTGDKEAQTNAVAVRTRTGDDLGTMSVDEFIQLLSDDVAKLGRSESKTDA
jgi:threonyl-tRNA synthetase